MTTDNVCHFDENVVTDYLDSMTEPVTMAMLFKELNIQNTEQNRQKITRLIIDMEYFVWDNQTDLIFPHFHALKEFSIRIQPTAMEIQQGILVPGHRLIPFNDGLYDTSDILLFDRHSFLDITEETFLWSEIEPLYRLVGLDAVPLEINVNDSSSGRIEGQEEVTIDVWDMDEFYRINNFTEGDTILLTPDLKHTPSFTVSYVPSTELKKQQKKIAGANKALLNSLSTIIRCGLPLITLSQQLFFAMYHMGPEKWKVPGSVLEEILKGAKDLKRSSLTDGRVILHFADQEPHDNNDSLSLQDRLLFKPGTEDFKIQTFDELMRYIDDSNGKEVVKALLLKMIEEETPLDFSEVMECVSPFNILEQLNPGVETQLKQILSREYDDQLKVHRQKPRHPKVVTLRNSILRLIKLLNRIISKLEPFKQGKSQSNESLQVIELYLSLRVGLSYLNNPDISKEIKTSAFRELQQFVEMLDGVVPALMNQLDVEVPIES